MATKLVTRAYIACKGPPVEVSAHWCDEHLHLTIRAPDGPRVLTFPITFVFTRQRWIDLVKGSRALYRPPEKSK